MRDRYYRVTSASEVPPKAVLVHVYRRLGQVLARLDGDDETDEAQPDLILFRAALERLRQDLVGTFVLLEDDALWRADWGDLIDYRGGRESEGPALHEAPALIIEPDLQAWDFILSRFRTAKPRPHLRETL